jgi:CRP-like cAMP-binding protein
MIRKDAVRRLGSVPLFSELSNRELRSVLGVAKEIDFVPGAMVVKEGTSGGDFYLILSGEARVSARGRTRATLGPGDYFGEIALLHKGTRTATVSAITMLSTLRLARAEFLALLGRNPSIVTKLLAELGRRVREAERSLTL